MKVKENSELRLYANTDITRDVQIAFKSKAGQSAYFAKKLKYTMKPFYYIRRNGHIRVELPIADAMECDYMSFINPSFENKTFYAKILNVEYVSNKVTEITFGVDNFQTYMFDVKYGWANINREHLSQNDYVKSIKNPYDPTIYEFQTSENLPSSRELEKFYTPEGDSVMNFPDKNMDLFPDAKENSLSVFLFISDFDVAEFPSIRDEFYEYFDFAVDSSGRLIHTYYQRLVDNIYFDTRIGRGYGIYQIEMSGNDNSGTKNLPGKTRLKAVINWLTAQGLDNNIIGMYSISTVSFLAYIALSFADKSKMQYITASFGPGGLGLDIDSGKLALSPYRYIRVYNNEGDCKEYKYEKFLGMINSDAAAGNPGSVEFAFIPALDGSPMTSLCPVDYEKSGVIEQEIFNTEERIDCKQIPQVGYTTDAYLAFIASQMNMNIATRTNNVSEQVNQGIDKAWVDTQNLYANGGLNSDSSGSDWWTAAKGIIGQSARSTWNGISNVIGSVGGGATDVASSIGNAPLADLRGESATWRSGFNYESRVLGPAKPAFVADEYHAGSTNGAIGTYIYNPRHPGIFTIQKVELKHTIMKAYDEFFRGYGYTSNRIGVPRICNYITGTGEQPHFSSFHGKEITYIKTSSMTVEYNLSNVCADIEAMFNSGIQLLKGEDL